MKYNLILPIIALASLSSIASTVSPSHPSQALYEALAVDEVVEIEEGQGVEGILKLVTKSVGGLICHKITYSHAVKYKCGIPLDSQNFSSKDIYLNLKAEERPVYFDQLDDEETDEHVDFYKAVGPLGCIEINSTKGRTYYCDFSI
jgi:hypothetical protein